MTGKDAGHSVAELARSVVPAPADAPSCPLQVRLGSLTGLDEGEPTLRRLQAMVASGVVNAETAVRLALCHARELDERRP